MLSADPVGGRDTGAPESASRAGHPELDTPSHTPTRMAVPDVDLDSTVADDAPEAYRDLMERYERVSHLESGSGVLYWDQQVTMPEGGTPARGKQLAALSATTHEKLTSDAMADALDVPFISGQTRHARRERLFSEFRAGDRDTLVISRVGDEGIDLPNAELAIVASGLGGSRRQGTQRAGRTMRPAGTATMYVLATRGTSEEEFAQRRMHHLSAKGVRVRETNVEGEGSNEYE